MKHKLFGVVSRLIRYLHCLAFCENFFFLFTLHTWTCMIYLYCECHGKTTWNLFKSLDILAWDLELMFHNMLFTYYRYKTLQIQSRFNQTGREKSRNLLMSWDILVGDLSNDILKHTMNRMWYSMQTFTWPLKSYFHTKEALKKLYLLQMFYSGFSLLSTT